MNRFLKWLLSAVFGLAVLIYAVSFLWPTYDWDLRLPSPDGQYDLVVLRGDKAAFDDFTYSLYIFPHNLTPPDRTKGSRVWLTQIWRGTTYLVYSGYDYPMFRWTGDRSIEIDLDELYYSPFQLDPVKWLGDPKKPVLVSLLFETKNIGNSMP